MTAPTTRAGVKVQAPDPFVGEARHNVPPGAIERAVVGQNRGIGRSRNRSDQRGGERAGAQYNAHLPPIKPNAQRQPSVIAPSVPRALAGFC